MPHSLLSLSVKYYHAETNEMYPYLFILLGAISQNSQPIHIIQKTKKPLKITLFLYLGT